MRRLTTFILGYAFVLACILQPASAYTLHYTDSSASVTIRWASKTIRIALSSSLDSPPSNIKQGSDVRGALRRAVRRWADATGVQFVEAPSDALSISRAGNGDKLSLITVADTPENRGPFDGEDHTGRTRVFFDPATGEITEADLAINPSATFSTDGTPGTYDLEETFTHEVGHIMGLEHSKVAGSIMQPSQGINGLYQENANHARELSDDDIAGARALFDRRESFGTVSGSVFDSNGLPAVGAHVWAEETRTGRVVAGNMSTSEGQFRIEGLAAGHYRIVTQNATEDRGTLRVAAGGGAQQDIEISSSPTLKPLLFGRDGHLSTIAVPLERGKRARIFIGGDGMDRVSGDGVSVSSRFIRVEPASLTLQSGIAYEHPIISFDVEVARDAQPGDYTIRLQSKSGELAFVSGGLTIEPSDRATAGDEMAEGQAAIIGTLRVVSALLESSATR